MKEKITDFDYTELGFGSVDFVVERGEDYASIKSISFYNKLVIPITVRIHVEDSVCLYTFNIEEKSPFQIDFPGGPLLVDDDALEIEYFEATPETDEIFFAEIDEEEYWDDDVL